MGHMHSTVNTPIRLKSSTLTKAELHEHISRIGQLSELKVLELEKSNIETIEENAFEGLTSLEYLALNNNNLKKIESTTFKGLSNLKMLIIFSNQIEEIERNAFVDLRSLLWIDLQENKLTEIEKDVFKMLTSLIGLDLSHNEITDVSLNAFSDLSALRFLDLDTNKLTNIDKRWFFSFTSIAYVGLLNNKFDRNFLSYFDRPLAEISTRYYSLSHLRLLNPTENDIHLFVNSTQETKRNFFDGIESMESRFINELEQDLNSKGGYLSNWNSFLDQFPAANGEIFSKFYFSANFFVIS